MSVLKRVAGFTIIELLTVIAVVALLATLAVPIANKAIKSAEKTKIANNLRQIGMAYSQAIHEASLPKIPYPSLHDWISNVAKQYDLIELNLWLFEKDPLRTNLNKLPKTIFTKKNGRLELQPIFKQLPLSLVVANNIPSWMPPSLTPILWTRGLREDGYWAPLDDELSPGLFGDQGGFIVFLDGHVQWYKNLVEDPLIHPLSFEPITNIFEIFPKTTTILDSNLKISHNAP